MKKFLYVLTLIIFFVFNFNLKIALGQSYCWFTSVGGVAFQDYDGTRIVDATGYIKFKCSSNNTSSINIIITLSKGLYSNNYSMRYMKNTNNNYYLAYNLYIDAARTQIWGDGSGGTFVYSASVTPGVENTVIIYGRIPANQNPFIGNYEDRIIATITP